MMKLCPRCNLVLNELEFNWKIKGKKRAVHCKECSRKYIRQHYEKNTQYYLNKAKKRNAAVRKRVCKYVGAFLKSHPCVDCNESDILVLEFDHKERKEKSYNVSYLMRRGLSFDKLIEEIKKCDVRCANCHRRKTEKESNSWKLKFAPVV